MKRKQIFTISIMVLLLSCLTGCETQTNGQETGETTKETEYSPIEQPLENATNTKDNEFDPEEQAEKANDFDIPVYEQYHSNPIDRWRREMIEEYRYSGSWRGPISYEYRSAWEAELEYRVQLEEGTEQAAAYLEAVEQEAEALTNLWSWYFDEQGGNETANGQTLNEAVAQVYKNAVFQLPTYYLDYVFDPEAATEELLKWK